MRLTCDTSKVDPSFLYYFFRSSEGQHKLLVNTSQTGVPAISRPVTSLKAIRLNLPPLPEQKAIARILGSLDDKIELNRQMNVTLEALAQTLFRAWFVDFEPVKAKAAGLQPVAMDAETAALFPSEFEESLPKSWEMSPLTENIDYLEGPGLRNWQYTTEGMKFLNIRCINDGDLDVSKATCISDEEFYQKYRHFALHANDIVISTSGTIGRSAIVRQDHLPIMLNTSIIRMKGKGAFGLAYIWNFLKSSYFLNEMNVAATGSAQLNFGPIHLRRIQMLRPPDEILLAFERVVAPLVEKPRKTERNPKPSRKSAIRCCRV